MSESIAIKAGKYLRKLINDNYSNYDDFAYDFGADIRTISRYINSGINKVKTIEELACFFNVSPLDFFMDE